MITPRGMREAGANLVAAGLYLVFAVAHLAAFAASHRPSLLLVFAIETLAGVLFVLRTPATRASFSPYSWITTLGGTFMPFLLRPIDATHDVWLGQVVQCCGAALAAFSLASLNRSFGLLPAVRALRVGGAYRWVRHPLYTAYTVQSVGYLVSNASARNLAIVAVAFAFQILRLHNEEHLLSTVPEYEAYKQQTRWRLFPLVF